jgi:uncharacterized protein (TIGR00255 family)
MIKSMTAYARQQARGSYGELSWELRSVNHRYLEPSLRLPEELRALDPGVRERLGRRLHRGKLECTLKFTPRAGNGGAACINAPLLEQLLNAAGQIGEQLGDTRSPGVMDLLCWPGMLEEPQPDFEQLHQVAFELLDLSLNDLLAAREREGARLKTLLEQRCERLTELIAAVRERLPEILTALRKRLLDRLADLRGKIDETRIEQEMVLLAQRCDVDEEVDRLAGHIEEVRNTLNSDGPVGRRLDFLMQELNREANTLGSKSVDQALTRVAVDMKVLIEQMREQVQNLE